MCKMGLFTLHRYCVLCIFDYSDNQKALEYEADF